METQNNNFNQEQNKNMQPCASCGNMVSKNAKSCPNCGAKIKKPIYKRVWFILLMVVGAMVIIAVAAGGGNSDTSGSTSGQTSDPAGAIVTEDSKSNIGDYKVEIKSCKLSKDYEGKPVAIVTYAFTNNAKEAAAFYTAFTDHAYQNGVEAEKAFIVDDDYTNNNNQSKEIKSGVTIDVQVAYVLNDTSTPLEVEVGAFLSFDDTKVTKTFNF